MLSPLENGMKDKEKKGTMVHREAIGESRRILEEAITLLEQIRTRHPDEAEVLNLDNLVRIALEYLKIVAEPPTARTGHFDLHLAIKRVLSLLDYQMRIRDIKILYVSAEEPHTVSGEEVNLVRMLLFLLMNIIKHYELAEGPREITIETTAGTETSSIIIRDRLSSQDLDSHARQLMRELLEEQGYRIQITHTETERICRIEIPVRESSSKKALNILIVDDDPIICEYLKDLFTFLGHNPIVVSSPSIALKMLQSINFDLLLVDFIMPEMNGGLFLKEAKKFCNLSNVCFFTGDTHAPEVVELRKREGVRVLAKPVSINVLKEVLREAGGEQ